MPPDLSSGPTVPSEFKTSAIGLEVVMSLTDTSSIEPVKSTVGVNVRLPVPVAVITWV